MLRETNYILTNHSKSESPIYQILKRFLRSKIRGLNALEKARYTCHICTSCDCQ